MFPGLAEVTLCRRCSVGSGGTLPSGHQSCVLLCGLHAPSVVVGLTAVGHWRGGWPPPQRWRGPALCGGCGIARWQGRIPLQRFPGLVLACCWVGPGPQMAGCAAWGAWGLRQPAGESLVISGQQENPRMTLASAGVITEEGAPWNGFCWCLWPQEEPQLLSASLTVSLRATGGSEPDSSNYCLSTGTGTVWVCLCPLRVESLFLVVLWVSLLDVNVRHSGSSSSCCRSPGLGSLMWDQTPHSLGRTSATVWHSFCLWVSSLEGVGHDCVASMPLLLNSFFISLAVEKLWEIFLLASGCSQR